MVPALYGYLFILAFLIGIHRYLKGENIHD